MYLSEMLDAVESKMGKPLFPQEEERKADPPVEQITNIPKAENVEPTENVEPPDDPAESTLEQEE